MSVDRLSNMLSSIKNAVMAEREFIETFYSKECEGVAKILLKSGYLTNVKTFKDKGSNHKGLRIDFAKDNQGNYLISRVKRVSKPGRRFYVSGRNIKSVAGGRGILVVSTSKGIMSGTDAKKRSLGGEVICEVS